MANTNRERPTEPTFASAATLVVDAERYATLPPAENDAFGVADLPVGLGFATRFLLNPETADDIVDALDELVGEARQ